ncbi:MAG: hypothetical protein WCH99_06515 [Verrucomicrobiota bacterium]
MQCGYALRQTMQIEPQNNLEQAGLVDGPRLLETLFPNPVCRPSLRWLRTNQDKLFHVRIGRLVWFDPKLVKAQLEARAMGKVKG